MKSSGLYLFSFALSYDCILTLNFVIFVAKNAFFNIFYCNEYFFMA